MFYDLSLTGENMESLDCQLSVFAPEVFNRLMRKEANKIENVGQFCALFLLSNDNGNNFTKSLMYEQSLFSTYETFE